MASIVSALVTIAPAQAACAWRQPDGESSTVTDGPLLLASIGWKLFANKHWYEDKRYAVGSLMGTDTTSFSLAGGCSNLREVAGARLEVVYVPPADAVRQGQGYRLKTGAEGVAIDLEFATGTWHTAGLSLGQSTAPVSGGGVLPASGFRAVLPLRLTIVKTAAFSRAGPRAQLTLAGDLGQLRYYKAGEVDMPPAAGNPLRLPQRYGPAEHGFVGTALAPHCALKSLGDMALDTGTKVIRLAAVKQRDFKGPGAIEQSAVTHQLGFSCEGSEHTRPTISLDATYPFNGDDGVGLPAPDSDVGVQVLFDGQPVKFGARSRELAWNTGPLHSVLSDARGAPVSPQGWYCRGDCSGDMRGTDWVNGGAAQGDNQGHEARLTLRYYQTTGQVPQPRSFAVPFTLTLELQ